VAPYCTVGSGSESSTGAPFDLSGVDGVHDRVRTRPFLMESWPLGFGKVWFCYTVAEYEWVIGRRGCCGTWLTFLGEGGE
jgi:hypothetical protein